MRNRLPAIWAWLVRRVHTLDLLPQYLKAVYNAWHDYLWTALPVAPIVVCWMIGGPVNPPEWLVVSAFVWALMVAGYYTWRKDHEGLIPKLGLRVPGFRIHKTPDSAQQRRLYLQILPECLSESPVEECTALLLRITRYEHASEQWSPTELDHAIPLMWSYSDAAPHTLYPGVDYRVNVLWFVDRGHIGLETWPQTVAAQYVFSQGELWQFDIRLTAKGTKPVDVSLRVAFSKERDGCWYEELTVEQL